MVTLRGGDAAGHLVESTEINGIQGFEYGFALGNSDRRLDHLVTVTRGNQGAARVQNAMLILPIREEVYGNLCPVYSSLTLGCSCSYTVRSASEFLTWCQG